MQVFERVPVQPRDAREASDVFYKQGTGDALLNYENEVIFTNRAYSGQEAMPYVAPHHNVRASTLILLPTRPHAVLVRHTRCGEH